MVTWMEKRRAALVPEPHWYLEGIGVEPTQPAMIKRIMQDHNVPSLPELIASAQDSGVRRPAR
jgi:hypothetical protein